MTRRDDDDALRAVPDDAYVLGAPIAAGGMGRIVAAHDTRLGRPVAIKEMREPSPELEVRFRREALVTARLQHPAIVPVYEAGRFADGHPFFAMKLVEGRSLDRVLSRTTELEERLALLPSLLAVADAVAYAHKAGVVHRDLKPANVLVGELGETVVIDWGLAKILADREDDTPRFGREMKPGETAAGSVLGTPGYMAPEQAAGGRVDARADVFALGAMLYEVLAGAPAYGTATPSELMARVLTGPPKSLARHEPRVPDDLLAIVDKAMAHRPDDRYPTAAELAADLRRYQTGQLVGAHAYSLTDHARRWGQKHRAAVVVGAIATVMLGLVAAGSVRRILDERDRADRARVVAEQARAEALSRAEEATRAGRLAEARGLLADARRADALGRDDEALALLRAAARPESGDAARDDAERAGLRALAARPLAHVLAGHRDEVSGVFALRDRVVTLARDGQARVWDPRSGVEVARIGGTDAHVTAIAPLPGGARFAVGLGDRVEIWEAAGGTRRLQLEGATQSVVALAVGGSRVVALAGDVVAWDLDGALVASAMVSPGAVALAVSPQGELIATGDGHGLVRLFDAATTAIVEELQVGASMVTVLRFSPDGSRLFIGNFDGTARLRQGPSVLTALPNQASLRGAAFAPDGAMLATLDGGVALWDAQTGTSLGALPGRTHLALALTPDGAQLVTGGADGRVRVFDAATRALAADLGAHGGATLALTVDDGVVLSGAYDGTVRLTELPAPSTRAALRPRGDPYEVSFTGDGARVICASSAALLRAWDAHTGAVAADLASHTGAIDAVAVWRSAIATASEDHTLRVVRADASVLRLEGHRGPVVDVRFSASGARLASASDDGSAILWDTASGALLQRLVHPQSVTSVAFAPDGEHLATGCADGRARLYQIGEDTVTRVLSPAARVVWDVAFSPDGARLATASEDRRADLWEVSTGAHVASLGGHPESVRAVLFAPRGDRLVTLATRGTARLWDARTGAPIASLEGLTGPRAQFAPDGSFLAIAASDVRLIDPRTGSVRAVVPSPASPATGVAVSPDGRRLAFMREDGRIVLADVPPFPTLDALLAELGARTNLRVCPSGEVVPVLPYPDADTSFAPPEACDGH